MDYDHNSSDYLIKRELYLAVKLSKLHRTELKKYTANNSNSRSHDQNIEVLNLTEKYAESLDNLPDKIHNFVSIGRNREINSDFKLSDDLNRYISQFDKWLDDQYTIKSKSLPTPIEQKNFYNALYAASKHPMLAKQLDSHWDSTVKFMPSVLEFKDKVHLEEADPNGQISLGKNNLRELHRFVKTQSLQENYEASKKEA